MPRPTLSRADRAQNVALAVRDLPTLLATAQRVEQTHGGSAPQTLRAWEAIEIAGATVHRQSRLLAGKSRGG